MNKILLGVIGGVFCILLLVYVCFSGKEYVVTIPEQAIREKLDQRLPARKTYLFIFDVSLDNPRVDLDSSNNRIIAGLDIELNIQINNQDKPLGGTVDVSGDLRYVPSEGAFYLVDPVIESLSVQGVPASYSDKASKVVEKAIARFYSSRPIYTLKASDAKQAAAKLVLKNLKVEEEAIVVTLGI